MKFLALIAASVASASAQLVNYPNGAVAPVETPEVQAAKAAHFAAHGAYAPVYAYNGLNPINYNLGYYPGQLVAYANGAVAPAKTPEVLQAEAEHFAAKGLPVNPWGYGLGYAHAYGYANAYGYAAYPGLVAHPNGALVPAEPADVVAARAEHLAAHAAA